MESTRKYDRKAEGGRRNGAARALGAGTSQGMRNMTVDWEEKRREEIPGRGNTMDKGVSRVPGTMGVRYEGFRMTDEGRDFSNHGLGNNQVDQLTYLPCYHHDNSVSYPHLPLQLQSLQLTHLHLSLPFLIFKTDTAEKKLHLVVAYFTLLFKYLFYINPAHMNKL